MKFYPFPRKESHRPCQCDADESSMSTVIAVRRSRTRPTRYNPAPLVRSQQIRHRKGDTYFWHWRDQAEDLIFP